MSISKQIDLKAKKDIIDSINLVIDRYIKEGIKIKQLKKYFNSNLALTNLIKDINESGRKFFDNDKDYRRFVYNTLRELLLDKKSEIETKEINGMNENKIIKYTEFENLIEAIDYKEISAEYLFDDIGYANDDMDILSSLFNVKEDYIEIKNKDYCLYTITDFSTNIMKNNRTKMDVLLLADFQIQKMKENVLRKILGGLYNKIPEEVSYMGILIKPHTVLDKEKIKESVGKIIDKNILSIISNITNYQYVKEYGNYHVWKKIK